MKAIHFARNSMERDAVKSVLKHYHVKEPVRVCRPGCRVTMDEGDMTDV